jgi:hypothetical protein
MIPQITDYLLRKLPDSFQGWTREAVEDYVMFHAEQGTLKIATQDDRAVARAVTRVGELPATRRWLGRCDGGPQRE